MKQKMVIKKKHTLIITYQQDKEKQQRCRPEFPITENYVKTGGGYTKSKKRTRPSNQMYAESARNIRKIGLIGDSHIGRLNKRCYNEKING